MVAFVMVAVCTAPPQTHLKKKVEQQNAIIDHMAGQLDAFEDKLNAERDGRRRAEAELAVLRQRVAQYEGMSSKQASPGLPRSRRPSADDNDGKCPADAPLARGRTASSGDSDTVTGEAALARSNIRIRPRRKSQDSDEASQPSTQPSASTSPSRQRSPDRSTVDTTVSSATLSSHPSTVPAHAPAPAPHRDATAIVASPRLFEHFVVVGAQLRQLEELREYVNSPPNVAIRIEPSILAEYPPPTVDEESSVDDGSVAPTQEIVADLCFPEGIGVEQMLDLGEDASYFKQVMVID